MSYNQPPYGQSNEQQPYGPPSYGQPAYGQRGAPLAPGAPWAAMPMRRPATVTAGSVLAFIGGGFSVVVGLLLAVLGGSGQITETLPDMYEQLGTYFAVLGIVLVLVGALVIFLGVMAFKGKRWGAIGLAVFAGLAVIGGISDLASGSGGSLLGVAWSVTGAVLLLVRQSQDWYRSQQR